MKMRAKSEKIISQKNEHKWFNIFYNILHTLSLTQDPLYEDEHKIIEIHIPQKKECKSVKHLPLQPQDTPSIVSHPGAKYIWGTIPPLKDFRQFIRGLHQGVIYALNNLKGPTIDFINKKAITLPQRTDAKQKFLILDLDETLIHCSPKGEIRIQDTMFMSVRPFCQEFLLQMNNHFEIYVFTAASAGYALEAVQYLNRNSKTIQGILSRENCMYTSNGLKIKDLRIIKNRTLKDIVIIDNLVHSFGLQIDNGIPILNYRDNKQDVQLKEIQPFLIRLSKVEDVRKYLRQQLKLRSVEYISEDYFLKV